MDPFIVSLISATFIVVGITVVALVVGAAVKSYFETKQEELKLARMDIEYKATHRDRKESLDYSKDMLEFTRGIVAQMAVIYFKKFTDSHNMEKVTLAQVKKIVEDISKTVNKSIIRSNIEFDQALFTNDFYDSYIIEITSMYVKQLLEKYLIEVVEQ